MTLPDVLHNSRFLRACRRDPVDTTPVWIMRQAGRYLPEYMAVRSKVTFLELCKRPDLAAEVTLSAQRALGVDAAILFADLLPILEPMGLELEYAQGEGPVIHNPVREAGDVDRVTEVADLEALSFVFETVRLVRRDLPADIPLIGFAGAPFTLASYVVEGGGSRSYFATKRLMYTDHGAWQTLMNRLAASLARYLRAQIDAGCQAVQLFDSWAGCLSPADYAQYVGPYTKAVIDGLPRGVPVINFLTGNPALLPLCRDAGGDVIGLDWRIDLSDGWRMVGYERGVQGNLDPAALLADLTTLRQKTEEVLNEAEKRPGHIFNLGHGVMPEANPDHVKALVHMVHELGAR
ncbi:MAG: uroporphyrinogen decarboxylase [Planctomycetaceae bacterium]